MAWHASTVYRWWTPPTPKRAVSWARDGSSVADTSGWASASESPPESWDVETDTIIHIERIDGMVTELFALQDQLAVGVRRELIRTRGSMKVPTLAVGRAPTPNETVAAGVIDPMPSRDSAPVVSPRGGIAVVPAGLIDGPPPPAPPEIITRDAAGRATVRAVRLTGPWQLDGVLSEEIYQQVPALSDFIQQLPDEGAVATERTEVWVFFDDAHVYTSAGDLTWSTQQLR